MTRSEGNDFLRQLAAEHRARGEGVANRIFGRSREDDEIAAALLADAEAHEKAEAQEGTADDHQDHTDDADAS